MITVLSEEKDFLVVYKPPGLDFHTDQGAPGFFRQVEEMYRREELYPVHRLDKMTSGLILIARSSAAAAALGRIFTDKGMEKYYLALSDKKPRKKQGLVMGDMVRGRRGCWKLTRSAADPGRTYFYSSSLRPGVRLFLLRIYTGKTHQIRVAMKSLGAPVLGDPRYYKSGPVMDRGYLHAWCIRFFWKGQPFEFRCEPEPGRLFLPEEGFDLPPLWERPEDLAWPDF
jgi:tRNA pseudouridine32 synthase/23S rRNA pseudouridine746 synthase